MEADAVVDEHEEPTKPTAALPYAIEATAVVAALDTDATSGLSAGEAAIRLGQHGPNEITSEPPPSIWAVAAGQFRNPMNIMLVAVTIVSFAIGEVSTGIIVALLILLNVVLGIASGVEGPGERRRARRACRCRRPRSCGTGPSCRCRRWTSFRATSSRSRRATSCRPTVGSSASATLETQEAALTGESAPVAKDVRRAPDGRRRPR